MCFIAVGGFSRNLTRNVYKRYQGLFMNFMFKEHFPWHSATKRQHSPMSKLTETAWIWIEQVVTVSLRNLKKKMSNPTSVKWNKLSPFCATFSLPKFSFKEESNNLNNAMIYHEQKKKKVSLTLHLPPPY